MAPHSSIPADYDAVASLYDRAFRDIRVRRDEWRWLSQRFDALHAHRPRPRVLDIGCGNGALLIALQDKLQVGVGVDVSTPFITLAQHNASAFAHLTFQPVRDAALPFRDDSFDVVTSFLTFRYLDWDAVLREVLRVLAPQGRLLIVDMVEQRASPRDLPLLARSGLRHLLRPVRDRDFHRNVKELTAHPEWHRMLQRNPIRPEAAYRACLSRWFPERSGRALEALNCTWTKRVIAFDSGPLRKP